MAFIQIQSWECAGGCLETMRPSSHIIFRLKLIYRALRFPFKARQDHYPYARAQRARSTFQCHLLTIRLTSTLCMSDPLARINGVRYLLTNGTLTSSDSLTKSLVSPHHFFNTHEWISSPHFPPLSLILPTQSLSPRPRPLPRHPSTRTRDTTAFFALSHRLL